MRHGKGVIEYNHQFYDIVVPSYLSATNSNKKSLVIQIQQHYHTRNTYCVSLYQSIIEIYFDPLLYLTGCIVDEFTSMPLTIKTEKIPCLIELMATINTELVAVLVTYRRPPLCLA